MVKKKTRIPSQLPNAPLVEVVFELRWQLEGDTQTPAPLQRDPGYSILAENFSTDAASKGFNVIRKLSPAGLLPGHSVVLRFYKGEKQPFPIWQIGPGIFAANDSAAYEWNTFKKLALDGTRTLLLSYPKMKTFSLKPNHLELRYTDSIDSSFIAHRDVFRFLNEQTSMNVEIPAFLRKKPLGTPLGANLDFSFPISTMRNTEFHVRISNARVENKETIVLISKVLTRSQKIGPGGTTETLLKFLREWLENAHAITSPFFKQFVSQPLMEQFESGRK